MMGQHDLSEAFFYCFRLEDQIPEDHLPRPVLQSLPHELETESALDWS